MQGFCTNAKKLLMGDVKFAGGPDIGNSTGWTEGGQGDKIPQTIDACINVPMAILFLIWYILKCTITGTTSRRDSTIT